MATFKVGQRVRCVYSDFNPEVIGREATIIGIDPDGEYVLSIDGLPDRSDTGAYWASTGEGDIVPMTDPRAQEFIEDMERFSKCTEGAPLVAVQ